MVWNTHQYWSIFTQEHFLSWSLLAELPWLVKVALISWNEWLHTGLYREFHSNNTKAIKYDFIAPVQFLIISQKVFDHSFGIYILGAPLPNVDLNDLKKDLKDSCRISFGMWSRVLVTLCIVSVTKNWDENLRRKFETKISDENFQQKSQTTKILDKNFKRKSQTKILDENLRRQV